MAKNVLIFSTAYLPLIGGAELAVKEITDRLPEYRFFLITSRMNRQLPKSEKIGNVEVYRVGFGFSFDKYLLPIFGFLKAKSFLKANNFNLIWAIMASYGGIAAWLTKKFYQKVPFLLIGDGCLKQNLKKQAEDSGLKDSVIFLGAVPPEDVYQYLFISDVFVRPSRSEGLGSAFIEAMACGLPIIGTNVGGIPDFLKDRKTGLFCEIDNPENLAAKTKELLENKELREQIIQKGLKLVEEKYSWDKISTQMKNIFEKVESL